MLLLEQKAPVAVSESRDSVGGVIWVPHLMTSLSHIKLRWQQLAGAAKV